MTERIKLIWDFRGPSAKQIAAHHAIHLKEFADTEKLQNFLIGSEDISENYSLAYFVVENHLMQPLRESLKPHRGQHYDEN